MVLYWSWHTHKHKNKYERDRHRAYQHQPTSMAMARIGLPFHAGNTLFTFSLAFSTVMMDAHYFFSLGPCQLVLKRLITRAIEEITVPPHLARLLICYKSRETIRQMGKMKQKLVVSQTNRTSTNRLVFLRMDTFPNLHTLHTAEWSIAQTYLPRVFLPPRVDSAIV